LSASSCNGQLLYMPIIVTSGVLRVQNTLGCVIAEPRTSAANVARQIKRVSNELFLLSVDL
jgi:hypothetical protein